MSDLKQNSKSFLKTCAAIKTYEIPNLFMAIKNSRKFKTPVSKINISCMLYESRFLRRYMLSFKIQRTLVKSISKFHRIPGAIENLICSYLDYAPIIKTLKKEYPRI